MKQITESDLKLLSHRQQVQFAVFCAKRVEFRWKNEPACVAAVAAAEAWLEGKATEEECEKAANAAAYAANAAAYATYAAYNAAYAVAYAANAAYAVVSATEDADKENIIAEQWNYFYTLLGELGKILYF